MKISEDFKSISKGVTGEAGLEGKEAGKWNWIWICSFLSMIKFCLCCKTLDQPLTVLLWGKKSLKLPAQVPKQAAWNRNLKQVLRVQVCHLQTYCFIILEISQKCTGSSRKYTQLFRNSCFWKAVTWVGSRTAESGPDSHLLWRVYLNSPFLAASCGPAAGTVEASGSLSPASCFREGWYSTSQRAILRGEVSPGRWSLTISGSVEQPLDSEIQLSCGPVFSAATLCVNLLWAGTREICLEKMSFVVVIDGICCSKY